jgi:enoyl-CoA hydratase
VASFEVSRYRALQVRVEDGILAVGLNRPEVLNALDLGTLQELEQLWLDVQRDPSLRAMVLYGVGRAFSAGGDIRDLVDPAVLAEIGPDGLIATSGRLVQNMLQVEIPVIAAVHGVAAGLAANLALLADILVMGEEARIGDTHVKIGLAAGDSGAVIWPLVMPVNRAKEYLITGDWVTAQDARELGLTRHIVADNAVYDVAMQLAAKLAAGPLKAMRVTKAVVNQLILNRFAELMPAAARAEEITFGTHDHAEARDAFVARREPKFQGR